MINGIIVVGVGGTGSQVLAGLARLNCALVARGGSGFNVCAFDPDVVTEANVGRQLFTSLDIGYNKANVLVHRINMFYGTRWVGVAEKYRTTARYVSESERLVIACVDSKASRRDIAKQFTHCEGYWVMDCGNGKDYGQVCVGHTNRDQYPNPYIEHPELTEGEETDTTPSCSLAEALNKQSLFVNQMVATLALQIAADLTLEGKVNCRGAYFNLKEFKTQPIPL